MKTWKVVMIMCFSHVLSMTGFATFPALIPILIPLWELTNTQAGWVSGVFFAGYVLSVPILVSLTDRVDSRRIYIIGLMMSIIGLLGFTFLANGFWSALIWQTVHGAGIGGTYMTGLRVMTDRIKETNPSRAIAFYTAAFSMGTAASFIFSGLAAGWLGWNWAFGLSALGPAIAIILILLVLKTHNINKDQLPQTHLLDFRPVFKNREAMSYTLAYAGHSWELFALRSWIVAFLVFAGAEKTGLSILSATIIAAAASVIGGPISIIGNELSERYGRRKTIIVIMILASLTAMITGYSASLSLGAAALFIMIYSGFVMGDSASLTAGAAGAAVSGYRGATLAVHSILGFSGALLGPLSAGLALDLSGGQSSSHGWVIAFATIGFGSVMGLISMIKLGRNSYNT